MSNYLKTIEFEDVETMHAVLTAAKLAIEPDVWRRAATDTFVDDCEFVIWSESWSHKPVEKLWDFIVNDFDWSQSEMSAPDQSEIEISDLFEDCATEYCTTARVDALLTLPDMEFEHHLYQGDINRFIGEQFS